MTTTTTTATTSGRRRGRRRPRSAAVDRVRADRGAHHRRWLGRLVLRQRRHPRAHIRDRHRRHGGADRLQPAGRLQPVGVHGSRRLRRRGAQRKRGLAEPARACRHHDRQRRRCLGDRQGRLPRLRACARGGDAHVPADRLRLPLLRELARRLDRPFAHRHTVAGRVGHRQRDPHRRHRRGRRVRHDASGRLRHRA